MHDITKSHWHKDPFKGQGIPMYFKVIKNKKFTDTVSDSTLQQAFGKKIKHLLSFGIKNIYNDLKRLLK